MQINGINVDELEAIDCNNFPPEVPERVLQLDGDAACYKVTYDDTENIRTCINNFFSMVDYRRRMSGSAYVNIHLTGADKGGRYKIATVKKYQANRDGKQKPQNLIDLRTYLFAFQATVGETFGIILHENQEADDGMAQENYKAIQRGTPELSVIMAEDKDLTMCSGLHCDWNTFEITCVDGFGSIYLDDSTSTKKIKGFGTSFFWAQLLMGDGADNIPGLEKLGGELLNVFKPTKKILDDANLRKKKSISAKQKAAIDKRWAARKPSLCGAVLTYQILKNITNDLDAMHTVVACYRSFYNDKHTYTAWDGTEITRSAVQMLLEQAQLLWMRRVIDEDPRQFFKDVSLNKKWDGQLNA